MRQHAIWQTSNAKWMAFIASSLLLCSGCQQDLVHQRPMAELTQKAQAMIQAGDYNGAIARLESARDLNPEEPNTTYNLALAYQGAGRLDEALGLLASLADKPKAGGPNPVEVKKALGITWEAKADQLSEQVKAEKAGGENKGDGSGKPQASKPPTAETQQKEAQAEQAYATAINYYKEALSAGLKDPAIQQQVVALEERQKKKQAEAAPL